MDFDQDERKVRDLIKANSMAFNDTAVMEVMSFISDMTDYLLDVRIAERMKHTGESEDDAEKAVVAELAAKEDKSE